MQDHASFTFAANINKKNEISDSMFERVDKLFDPRVNLYILNLKNVRLKLFRCQLPDIGIENYSFVQALNKLVVSLATSVHLQLHQAFSIV